MTSATTGERIFDELGDLWLVVPARYDGTVEAVRFRVCSRALARCSPVFRTMLYGPFVEARPAEPHAADWSITLEDEDALALEDLLCLMHSRYDDFSLDPRLPDGGSNAFIEALYDFITTVDKYDCAGMTRPWAQSWISLLKGTRTSDRKMLRRLAWIYYQLGDREGFESTVRTLIVEFPPSEAGEMEFFGDGDEAAGEEIIAEAPGLEDSISSHRCSVVNSLLAPIRHLEKGAFGGMSNFCAVTSAPYEEREACQERLRRAAIRHLLSCGFWPLPRDLKLVSLTPRELERLLGRVSSMSISTSPTSNPPLGTYSRAGLDDTMASPAMSVYAAASRVNSQVNGTPHALSSRHMCCTVSPSAGNGNEKVVGSVVEAFEYTATFPEARHLEAQAIKTGLCLTDAGSVRKAKTMVKSGRTLVSRTNYLASAGSARSEA
ncbi:uncharacterized protein B0I36DRAFT_367268 [Microdochium trichocladiopsis]|uniref:BTB domain-containing protein n=1 Tax=Microdochium trichocladiopsis TaxID=1682393 RepID=A0A9P8XYD2_9PEZI|nr:uncharacterized protein B0I36DRAFT_367268 [Microdochium trichocladiopsis]KAH7020784.1 hypothetical protein B0I36DRAFT_367268 [Microdochium trichocladiopsis]